MADYSSVRIDQLERAVAMLSDAVFAIASNNDGTTKGLDYSILKADILNNPQITGSSTCPTPNPGDDSQLLANTTWVQGELSGTGLSPASATAYGTVKTNTTDSVPTVYLKGEVDSLLNNKADLASPSFSGTPTSTTPSTADNSTAVATTAFVKSNLSSYAPLASPSFSGTPTSPTPTSGDSSTKIATTAFVSNAIGGGGYAPLASPAFTGTPTSPTPTAGDSSTKIATTAFVSAGYAPKSNPSFSGQVYTNGYFSTNGTYYSSRSRLALSQDDGYIPTTEWVHDVLPTGVVIAYAAATTPDGWLFCDGSLVSKTTYAALYTVIGTSYGYDLFDSSVFRLPDYRHKFLRGHYSETLDSSASGGYDSVALSASNLPAHTHTVAAMANGTGTNFGGSGSFTQSNGSGTAGTLTTSSVGSGSAFSIIPTHHLVRYIIKYT